MAGALRVLPLRLSRAGWLSRARSSVSGVPPALQKGIVVGVHSEEGSDAQTLTASATELDSACDGDISRLLALGGVLKAGESRVLWGAGEGIVAAAGLGPRRPPARPHEDMDPQAEAVRRAAAAGVRALQAAGARSVRVDDMGCARAAAEGAVLAAYRFQQYRAADKRKPDTEILPLTDGGADWETGLVGAQCQNWARTLMETPGNQLTPALLARAVREQLQHLPVDVHVRERQWMEEQGMGCLLSVARGSAEPPLFIEMHYNNAPKHSKQGPVVLVGKGVTFDSGGISIKPSGKMAAMRGDMGGAAVVCATLRAAALLRLPLHLVGLVPATENMPDGRATKPGDVFTARNGKTVLVDNTDAEGRLILCDALCYAHDLKPHVTVDLATLTGAIRVSLGDAAAGLFSRDAHLVAALRAAAHVSGDRLWHMPLYQRYTDRVTGYDYVDVHNVGKGTGGGSCTAAAFLQEFAPSRWAHIDIAGVMDDTEDQPYVSGMTGRPMRTMLEFVASHATKL